MMQGRRHGRPLHGKARAMACGGNPRALPDLWGRDPRRRLSPLEALEAYFWRSKILRFRPTVGMILGMKFWTSIISAIRPSFLIWDLFLAPQYI